MEGQAGMKFRLGWLLAAWLILAGTAFAREEPLEPQFKYAGGTENIFEGCEGNLEMSATELAFNCRGGFITIPYSSIAWMEYRQYPSRKVLRMKLKWKLRPAYVIPLFRSKRNRFFTVLFKADGATRAMVLKVSPEAMRPYLAEIDLKVGKRVDVQGYEAY